MKRNKQLWGILFSLPSLIGSCIFFVIPAVMSLSYCFFDQAGKRQFKGFRVFKALFHNDAFLLATKNTLLLLGLIVPLLVIGGLIIAVILERSFKQKRYLGAMLLIPMALPSSSILLLWRDLLLPDGVLSHLCGLQIDLMQSFLAQAMMILLMLWKYTGYHVLIVISSLLIMPKDFEEAAKLDGARGIDVFLFIKLPYLMPILFFSTVMALMNAMKLYKEVYLLQGDFPYEKLYLLQHFMNNYFMKLDLEKLSAAAFILFLFMTVFIGSVSKLQQHFN